MTDAPAGGLSGATPAAVRQWRRVIARPDAFDSELSIRAVTGVDWALLAPLVWTGTQGDRFVVPVGATTDFATVPRFLHWLWLPYGPYTRAAVLHDWLLHLLAWWSDLDRRAKAGEKISPNNAPDDARPILFPDGALIPEPPINSRDIDGVFRRAMEDLGVPWAKRWLGWTAVRWGALFSTRRAYGRGIMRDMPRMLGMSVLAFPVILPGAIGVLISLGEVRIVNGVRRLFTNIKRLTGA